MKKILFRGKRLVTNEWVYGSLLLKNVPDEDTGFTRLRANIYDNERNEIIVDFRTIGVFTGIIDKNGRKIFDGDLVKTKHGRVCEVAWFETRSFRGWDLFPVEDENDPPDKYDLFNPCNLEVVGNIYDTDGFWH